jgi:glycosyltransferase involved in cell wall biosynthesis
MGHGAPVVTSAGTATEEVAGDAALLVDPRDHDAIGAALASVISNPDLAADLRIRGRERAARYTWRASAEAAAAVYREAAG